MELTAGVVCRRSGKCSRDKEARAALKTES